MVALRGGLLETLSLEALGFSLDISDRVGPASGLATIRDSVGVPLLHLFTEGNAASDTARMLLGASGTIGTRFAKALNKSFNLLAQDITQLTADENTILAVGNEWMGMASSYANMSKAKIWKHAHDILSNDNKRLFIVEDGEELPMAVYISKALGFDPTAKELREAVNMSQMSREKEKQDVIKAIHNEYRQFFNADGSMAPEAVRMGAARRASFLLGSLNEWDRMKVRGELQMSLDQEYGVDELQKKLINGLWNETPYSDKEQEIIDDVARLRAGKL
jgi:hypothetical protein